MEQSVTGSVENSMHATTNVTSGVAVESPVKAVDSLVDSQSRTTLNRSVAHFLLLWLL